MAAPDRSEETHAPLPGVRILAVEGRFYDAINDALVSGARAVVEQAGGSMDLITVPGALEIPVAIAIALDAASAAGRPYDGAVALGCVIRGETFHFDIVAGESSRALIDMAVARKLPLGNGILTVDTEAQALTRAKPSELDKGGDAARACLSLVRLKRHLASSAAGQNADEVVMKLGPMTMSLKR